MRRTFRLLASVKPARYLDPGAPTGLTGLLTHGSPRSTLLYLYSSTLEKLNAVPEHSLYRQSVEALTKHRMSIVESAVAPGYPEWAERARKLVTEHPDKFHIYQSGRVDGTRAMRIESGGQVFVVRHLPKDIDEREEEWDGEINEGPELEGPRTREERASQALIAERRDLKDLEQIEWEAEPQLTADQSVGPGYQEGMTSRC